MLENVKFIIFVGNKRVKILIFLECKMIVQEFVEQT